MWSPSTIGGGAFVSAGGTSVGAVAADADGVPGISAGAAKAVSGGNGNVSDAAATAVSRRNASALIVAARIAVARHTLDAGRRRAGRAGVGVTTFMPGGDQLVSK
ncbi:MAG: hypothetical protein HQL57_09665 [Magnetococcales bacterium]|nr:hypothetical protein [Magnetococcales bacterium]